MKIETPLLKLACYILYSKEVLSVGVVVFTDNTILTHSVYFDNYNAYITDVDKIWIKH